LDERDAATQRCLYCGSKKIVRGVMDRILDIADRGEPHVSPHRPQYHYQVPLEFIPGLGKRKFEQLLDRFGTEMNIIHRASEAEIASVVGEEIARYIMQAREGVLALEVGGGGQYGKVMKANES
jgi:PHP family Zn ribbon phosphoesterase